MPFNEQWQTWDDVERAYISVETEEVWENNRPAGTKQEFAVRLEGTYSDSSVLGGQYFNRARAHCDSLEEALSWFPEGSDPEVVGDGKPAQMPSGESLGALSGMPSSPPGWFDPADAGEAWGEDDY